MSKKREIRYQIKSEKFWCMNNIVDWLSIVCAFINVIFAFADLAAGGVGRAIFWFVMAAICIAAPFLRKIRIVIL